MTDNKIKFVNLCGNLGKDLINAIYSAAYRLEATEVIVNKAKYNKYADIQLNCENDCIAWRYAVNI